MAVACYARAMDHVGVMAIDPSFVWLDRVILDLHFDACFFQKDKSPWALAHRPHRRHGRRWPHRRPGARWRRSPPSGSWPTSSGGSHRAISTPTLWFELPWLTCMRCRCTRFATATVGSRASCSHWCWPARACCRQSSHRSRNISGAHTSEYYAVLQSVQGGRYQPERDATEWISFCIEAHLAQARQRLGQIEEAGVRWSFLENLVANRGWPDRRHRARAVADRRC